MNKMRILVTYAGLWKMDNGNTGLTLNYFMFGQNGELMEPQIDVTGGPVGQQRAKCSLDTTMRQKILYVPGLYDATMGFKIGSDGKPVMTIEDIDYLCQATIFPGQELNYVNPNLLKDIDKEKEAEEKNEEKPVKK